ncbi:MAG: acetylxylan esterase, partial [Calditrichaeota bacterium]
MHNFITRRSRWWLLFTIAFIPSLPAQQPETNYDESKVPAYTLPDPLVYASGQKVTSPGEWMEKRRPEIQYLFEKFVFGKSPAAAKDVSFDIIEQDENALDGKAIRKQIAIRIGSPKNHIQMNVLIYLPRNANKQHPVFVAMNFYGNHTIHSDPQILLTNSWVRNNEKFGITTNEATEASRGVRDTRWPVEKIIQRGYGLATVYYGDIDPDFDDGFQNGVHPLFYSEKQKKPAPDEWSAIAAWAWGLSRVLDYCEKDAEIDEKRAIVMGHSRLGKTALWAGAQDERFAIVISNNSGCGGAALSRRRFGETVKKINT